MKLISRRKLTSNPIAAFKSIVLWIMLIWLLIPTFSTQAQHLRYAEDRAPSTLNPVYADDMYSTRITELIFSPLIGVDKEQNPMPVLANRFEISKDSKQIVVFLKNGIKWHDGRNFTADDVIFTVAAMKHPKTTTSDKALLMLIKKVEKLGEFVLKFHFTRSLSNPARYLSFKILPKHLFDKPYIKRDNFFGRKPVGTGPFKFIRWYGNNKIELEKNPYYFAPLFLPGVDFQEITDKNIQMNVLKYGGLDIIIRVRPKDIPIFEKIDSTDLFPYSTLSWWYLAFNHKKSPFKNKYLKRALIFALDREKLREAHLGDGDTISGPYSPSSPFYNFQVEPRAYDPQMAKKLLAKAGYKLKGGVLKKGKRQLAFTITVDKSLAIYKNVCLDIQSQWNALGIKVDIIWMDTAEVKLKVFRQKKYDIYLDSWSFDELSNVYPLFHSQGSLNFINYKNRKVDKLLLSSKKISDPDRLRSHFMELHSILHQDVPYIFLWSLIGYSAINRRVESVSIHPFYYFTYAEEWKLKKPQ